MLVGVLSWLTLVPVPYCFGCGDKRSFEVGIGQNVENPIRGMLTILFVVAHLFQFSKFSLGCFKREISYIGKICF